MGQFSDLCSGCDDSIVADFVTGPSSSSYGEQGVIETWMSQVVVLTPEGSVLRGSYDGYGRVGGVEDTIGLGVNESWHEACWELAGSPTIFSGASDSDPQQGFWQEELVGKYDPRTTYEGVRKMADLKVAAASNARNADVSEPVKKAKKAKKAAGAGVGFFVPGLDPADPDSLRKALSELVLDPQKYLIVQ